MHVLVATAGALSPTSVVDFARHLIGGTGRVTVTTVVEVPREFLNDIGAEDWHPLRSEQDPGPQDDVAVSYLAERGNRITDPIKKALEAARIPCETTVLEGTDAAAEISVAANELDVDVVVLGATKPIFNVEAWESVSARVMIESGRPVLVLPQSRSRSDNDSDRNTFQPLTESFSAK